MSEKRPLGSLKRIYFLHVSLSFLAHVHTSRGDSERWNPAIHFILEEG